MCLDRVEKFPVKDHLGWKIFSKDGKGYNGVYYYRRNPMLPRKVIRRWTCGALRTAYESGFHVYMRRNDAVGERDWQNNCDDHHEYVVKRVKFGTIIVTGYQDNYKVIVAKTITIL